MKKTGKVAKLAMALGVFLMAAGIASVSGYAAEEKTPINKVNLLFESDIEIGEDGCDVDVTVNDDDAAYVVESASVINAPDDTWNVVESPVVEVDLVTVSDDYYFNKTNSSGFILKLKKSNYIKNVQFKKATRQDERTSLTLTVTLQFKMYDDENKIIYAPTNVKWSDDTVGVGNWERPAGNKYYQVRLEKDRVVMDRTERTNATTMDFRTWISEPGKYRFQVRNVDERGNKSKWISSVRIDVTADMTDVIRGEKSETTSSNTTVTVEGWQKTADGRYWWKNANGSYPENQWQKIEGVWYYFGGGGYMAVGWTKVNGAWYYLSADGAMLSGWQKLAGSWYYLGSDGAMAEGWTKVSGKTYFTGSDGKMVTGWNNIGNRWYYFSSDGAMVTGWQKIDGKEYYFSTETGAMYVGGTTPDGARVGTDGARIS